MATVTSSKRQLTHTSNTYESNGDVTIGGNLNINGTTTTIDTANLLVEDKNIIIGDVSSPSDTTADGGGITLKGASDKTINWVNSTDSWTSNQRFSAPNLTLTSLSNQSSEATALVVNGSNVVGYRELGSAAFSATSAFLGATAKAADSNLLDGYNAEEGAVVNSIVKRDGTASIKAFGLSLLRESTARTGITWYNESYYNWQDYMAAAGVTGCGPNGNLTAPTGLAGVTSWALRSRMEGVSTYGWNWETGGSGGGGATATSKMSLNATTGNLEIAGTYSVGSRVGTWITSSSMSDAIGWNTSYGVYIGSNVGGTHYLRGNGTFTTGGNTYDLWHAGNDGSGSGLDADLLDGAQPSVSASNNTIVKRHSSGYIYANYINTTANDVSSGVTRIMVETGNDGFMRHGDKTSVLTYLNVDDGADVTPSWVPSTNPNYLTSLGTAIVDGDFTANGLMKRTGAGTYTSITDNSSNWNTAYTDRNKWDGGSTGLNASTGRTSLGLGSAATQNTSAFMGASGMAANTDVYMNFRVLRNSNSTTANDGMYIGYGNSNNGQTRIFGGGSTGVHLAINATNMAFNSNTVWHAGNDGTGSGLDADLLDAQEGSYYRNATNLNAGTVAAARLSTASTQPPNDNSTKIATTAYVQTELSDLIGTAPAALDTLSELADAINDDSTFSSTVTTALGNRLRVDTASQGLNATQKSNARTNLGLGSAATSASSAFATSAQGTKADNALPKAGGTMTGDLTLNSTNPAINFNGTSDGSVDMQIYATPEGLDFREPEEGNRIHFRIYDDTGVDAPFGYYVNGTKIVTNTRILQNVTAAAGVITSGTFATARIPSLAASKITSGTFADARIASASNWNTAYGWGNHASAGYAASSHTHAASDITSGTLSNARIPEFLEEKYIYNSNDSNGVYMPMVKGGMYTTTSSSVTGAIKVTLPAYKSSMMFSVYVDVYEYQTGETVTLRVSGYAYGDTGASWHNCSVVNIADNTDRDYTVRFYSDTTNAKQYFTIGETNATWTYPQVNLRDFWGGYNTSESEAQGTWNIDFITSFSGTLRHTFTDNFAASDWDRIRDKPSTFAPSAHSAALLTSGTLPIARIADDAITGAKIAHNTLDAIHINASAVGASELNVSGNGTTTQFLRSDGDGTFTWATPTDTNTTYSAGNGISLSGTTFSVAAGGGLTQTSTGLSHTDTSSQSSVNNSNGTVIQDITLDTYGHITAIGSANLDSRYYTETETNGFLNLKANLASPTFTGNVGIGDSSPISKLHVQDGDIKTVQASGSFDGGTFAAHAYDINGRYAKYLFGINDTTYQRGMIYERTSGRISIINSTNTGMIGERLTVTTSGKVGIGTNNPTQYFEAFPDNNFSGVIGKVYVGYVGYADYAAFSHFDQDTTTGYALRQGSAGDTLLNAQSGQSITLRNSNYVIATVNSTGLDVNGLATASGFQTDTTNTSYNLITRNSTSTTLYVQAAQSNSTQTIASFRYGSATVNAGTETFRIRRDNVNVFGANFTVGGSITGNSKNFSIPHPTKEGKRLVHSCLEGPEIGVYFRGRSTSATIEMPDYWDGLVHLDSMTVELTAVGPNQDLYVASIADDGDVTVGSNTDTALNYFYVIYGERKDLERLEVEIDNTIEVEESLDNSEDTNEI